MRKDPKPAQEHSQPSVVERRLKIAIAAALFAGLALSPRLWLSERVYPMTPVLTILRSIPAPLDYLLYAALLAALVVIAAAARPDKWIFLFAALAIVLGLFDQSRWQPWFYQYLVMLIALGVCNPEEALNTCRLVLVCTYFWSGLQKANVDFIHTVFPFMMGPLAQFLPLWLGFLAPVMEVGIGVGLLMRRFRTYAIYAAIAMHAFILVAIGPFGQNSNSVVWPWNIAMICFLIILFRQRPELPAGEIIRPRGIYQMLVLLLFGIAPTLSFFNIWDAYLSSALYAGVRNTAVVYVTDALKSRLPKEIVEHVYPSNKPGTGILILKDWSMSELNAGIYPEPRIYKNLARYICASTHDPSEMKLWIKQTNVLFSPDRQVSYDCPALTAFPGARSGSPPTAP
jgi:hypothetical protein